MAEFEPGISKYAVPNTPPPPTHFLETLQPSRPLLVRVCKMAPRTANRKPRTLCSPSVSASYQQPAVSRLQKPPLLEGLTNETKVRPGLWCYDSIEDCKGTLLLPFPTPVYARRDSPETCALDPKPKPRPLQWSEYVAIISLRSPCAFAQYERNSETLLHLLLKAPSNPSQGLWSHMNSTLKS